MLMKPEGLVERHQTLSSWVGSGHKTSNVHPLPLLRAIEVALLILQLMWCKTGKEANHSLWQRKVADLLFSCQ